MQPNRPIPDIEYRLAVLQYVQSKADIRPFLKATGKDMLKLNTIINELLSEDILVRYENELNLTKAGMIHLKTLNNMLGRRGLYRVLLPDYTVRKEPIKKTDLYIPQYMYSGGGGHFSCSYILGRSDESSGDEESIFKRDK